MTAKSKPPATISDVSKQAKVSVATVSRVLSGSAKVDREKRDRVREAVAKLNYQPLRRSSRAAAAASGRGRSRVGVVVMNDDVLAPYSNDLAATVKAVAQALAEQGRAMIYADVAAGGSLPPEIESGQVAGLLVAGHALDKDLPARLRKLPTVWLTSHREPGRRTAALAGNEHVGQLAADYLIEHGCKQLACLDIATGGAANEVRRDFFAFTASQAGVGYRLIGGLESLPMQGDPGGFDRLETAARGMARELAAARPRIDGAFVTNPLVLGPIYRELRSRGLEPRRDVQLVVSGHHPPLLAALDPPPASIDLRGDVIGRCAVQHLPLPDRPSRPAGPGRPDGPRPADRAGGVKSSTVLPSR